MAKQLSPEAVQEWLSKQPTEKQLEIQKYIAQVLDEKQKAAEKELELIKKGGKEQ